jgi:hypothetical protein
MMDSAPGNVNALHSSQIGNVQGGGEPVDGWVVLPASSSGPFGVIDDMSRR